MPNIQIPHSLLQKNTCNNKSKRCVHLNPYYNLEIFNNNATSKERQDNLRRYKNSCKNRDGKIEKCCSKDDNEKLKTVLKKSNIPDVYGRTEYNRQGELEKIELCDGVDCQKAYQKLTPYEMCKIPKDFNGTVITDFVPDCFNGQCNPQERLANINGRIDENYTFEVDKQLSEDIQNNNLKNVKLALEKEPGLYNRVLTHNAGGNTVFHEALKYNSEHVLIYLFKNANKTIVNKLNTNGESILHLALLKNNPNIISMCLKLGSNIETKNNNDETPLYFAIRSGIYNNVLTIINNYANIFILNKDRESPFVVACLDENRDIKIVRLLVEKGSDIDGKTKDGKTILETLLEKKENTVMDHEIRSYLQNVKVKSMGFNLDKELSEEQTRKLEGILYVVQDKDEYGNKKPNFTLDISFNKDLEYPEDLIYPKDLEETKMKPYNVGKDNFSHEPYYQRFKNLHKDKIKKLKRVIQLTKWDNNSTEEEKLKIIDDIMVGKLDFDNYKYQVLRENGLNEEQEHLLHNIEENDPFLNEPEEGSPSYLEDTEKYISVRAKNDTIDEIDNPEEYNIYKGKEVPYNLAPPEITPPAFIDEYSILEDKRVWMALGCIVLIIIIIVIYKFAYRVGTRHKIFETYG